MSKRPTPSGNKKSKKHKQRKKKKAAGKLKGHIVLYQRDALASIRKGSLQGLTRLSRLIFPVCFATLVWLTAAAFGIVLPLDMTVLIGVWGTILSHFKG